MTAYLVDTNCLLSYFTDRSPEQHAAVTPYIEQASQLALSLTVTPHVLNELVHVLLRVYRQPSTLVADIVDKMLGTPGIDYLDLHSIEAIRQVWPEQIADYGDATIAATAAATGLTVLIFDVDFVRAMNRIGIACERPTAPG